MTKNLAGMVCIPEDIRSKRLPPPPSPTALSDKQQPVGDVTLWCLCSVVGIALGYRLELPEFESPPIPVAERCKARVCGRSLARIAGSNPHPRHGWLCCKVQTNEQARIIKTNKYVKSTHRDQEKELGKPTPPPPPIKANYFFLLLNVQTCSGLRSLLFNGYRG
jgi:hypothetical protein